MVAWPCYPSVSMWAPTPLMAWYCDQSHLIIRKRWTLSQSFTWFPLLPASLFPSLRLLSDTYAWFYSFITPAMSRYFSPRVYRRFFIFYFFSYGDAGVSLTPGATWSNLSRLFRRAVSSAVAGRILFYFFLLCWWELRRKEDIHMAEDTWINDKRNKDNLQIIWSPTKYTQCDSFKCTERISI